MVTFVFQAVVIIVLRQSKGLTGGAEGLQIPRTSIFGFRFSNDGRLPPASVVSFRHW